jgi:hypothetical protein
MGRLSPTVARRSFLTAHSLVMGEVWPRMGCRGMGSGATASTAPLGGPRGRHVAFERCGSGFYVTSITFRSICPVRRWCIVAPQKCRSPSSGVWLRPCSPVTLKAAPRVKGRHARDVPLAPRSRVPRNRHSPMQSRTKTRLANGLALPSFEVA